MVACGRMVSKWGLQASVEVNGGLHVSGREM